MVGKLDYLTVIMSDITFVVSVVCHFLSALMTNHLEAVMRILRYLKKSFRERAFLFRSWTHQNSRLLSCRLGMAPF